jgi:3-oxoacyl-[acyl-carrier protein] reductase
VGKLDGKTALITGGAKGLGRAIALLFAREGADVGVLDISLPGARDTATRIAALGRSGVAVAADVGEPDQVGPAIGEAAAALGRIDILVNNVGIDTNAPVVSMPLAMWDDMIRVNLRSVFLCSKAVLPGMIERKFGRIINIASQLAYKGAPEMAHYAAAKAGVLVFTRSLAYEVAEHNITVNAIAPGPIDTDLYRAIPEAWRRRKMGEVPLGRPGTVDEVAPAALLLAADDGAYYVGACISPNGGDIMV